MKELCVVHLVRAGNGIEPFQRFLESYRLNPGGIEHDLLIVFKGLESPQDTTEHRQLLASFRHETMEISDEGFDITAYFAAVQRYGKQYRIFCFLNSYSVILDSNWLQKLHENLCKPDVGLVGATGSTNSHHTNALGDFRNFAQHVRKRYVTKEGESHSYLTKHLRKPITHTLTMVWYHILYIIYFGPFPNYHIRTNAFMISGELIESLKFQPVKTKMDAYVFESGKKGLTKTILTMGKKAIIVGKDGIGYEKEAWHESNTFWQSDQENLLVADNQTRDYQDGSPQRRKYLSYMAWHGTNKIICF